MGCCCVILLCECMIFWSEIFVWVLICYARVWFSYQMIFLIWFFICIGVMGCFRFFCVSFGVLCQGMICFKKWFFWYGFLYVSVWSDDFLGSQWLGKTSSPTLKTQFALYKIAILTTQLASLKNYTFLVNSPFLVRSRDYVQLRPPLHPGRWERVPGNACGQNGPYAQSGLVAGSGCRPTH